MEEYLLSQLDTPVVLKDGTMMTKPDGSPMTKQEAIATNILNLAMKGDDQKKNRKVILHVDEEDFFDMLDSVNPKNIIKYLDMRRIPHRDSLEITVTENKVRLSGKASPEADKVRRGLYNSNKRNRIKLNRALELLDNLKTEGKA